VGAGDASSMPGLAQAEADFSPDFAEIFSGGASEVKG
jgi:hypothetical protein